MVRDTKIDELNNKLEPVDTSTLTNLSSTNSSVLEVFSNRISTVTSSTSDDNWDDAVKKEINDAITKIVGSINDVITSCSYIANSKTIIDNLKKLCSSYVTEYDKYESMKCPPEKIKDTDIYGNSVFKPNPAYDEYVRRKKAFEDSLPPLADEVHRIEEVVKNYFNAIDLDTNTIDANIYVEGSGNIQFDYSKYFDGSIKVESEGWKDPPTVTEEVNAEEQTIEEHKEGEYERRFEDGSEVEADRTEDNTYQDVNGDGKIDETDKLIYQKVYEDGTFTDKDGNVYGYLHDEESDTIGLVKSSTTLTDRETGKTVYEEDQERLGAYQDAFELDHIEGEVVTKENGKTTHTRTASWSNGTDGGEKSYSYTRIDADPSCGECTTYDGDKYEYYKKDGVLYERFSYLVDDGNGNLVYKVAHDSVHEPSYVTFSITDQDGKSLDPPVSIQVDIDSSLDQLMVNSYIDRSVYECGDLSSSNINALRVFDFKDITITGQDGKGYQFHMDY